MTVTLINKINKIMICNAAEGLQSFLYFEGIKSLVEEGP